MKEWMGSFYTKVKTQQEKMKMYRTYFILLYVLPSVVIRGQKAAVEGRVQFIIKPNVSGK